jgi:hypothetical protein
MNEILLATKELLGIPEEVTEFDSQLVNYINMVLVILNQLGVGITGYQTSATTGALDEFLPVEEDVSMHSLVQMYIYTKVRLLFDPPTSSFVLSSLQGTVQEYEWRLTDYISNAPIVE